MNAAAMKRKYTQKTIISIYMDLFDFFPMLLPDLLPNLNIVWSNFPYKTIREKKIWLQSGG